LAPENAVHDYFQDWPTAGIFEKVWQLPLEKCAELVGLDSEHSVDGAMTKAPLGGEQAGTPTGLAVTGANVHDIRLLKDTIDNCFEQAPSCVPDPKAHLCPGMATTETNVGNWWKLFIAPPIRSRGEEHRGLGPTVVGRTHR